MIRREKKCKENTHKINSCFLIIILYCFAVFAWLLFDSYCCVYVCFKEMTNRFILFFLPGCLGRRFGPRFLGRVDNSGVINIAIPSIHM